MSSRLSGLQQKTPDNLTWCDGVVVRWADGDLQGGAREPLTTSNISRRLAAVHKVLKSIALQTPTNSHSELELDALRSIQPMELAVEQMCQAAVELVSSADYPCKLLHSAHAEDDQYSGVWRPGQHGVAAVNTGWDDGVYQCPCGLSVKRTANSLNLTKPVKARWTCAWNVLKVRLDGDTE